MTSINYSCKPATDHRIYTAICSYNLQVISQSDRKTFTVCTICKLIDVIYSNQPKFWAELTPFTGFLFFFL